MRAAVLLLTFALAIPAAAQPRDAERAVLPGLIVDDATAPRDARGAVDEARIRGARAYRGLDAQVMARRQALEPGRDAAAATASGAAAVRVPPLPGDAQAPPRMDAGDPDPDRLQRSAPSAVP
ncbi:MAG: hypothetical protein U0802_17525 [Candidatus Binatia bacterium]